MGIYGETSSFDSLGGGFTNTSIRKPVRDEGGFTVSSSRAPTKDEGGFTSSSSRAPVKIDSIASAHALASSLKRYIFVKTKIYHLVLLKINYCDFS